MKRPSIKNEFALIHDLHKGITADAPLHVQVRLSLLGKAVDRIETMLKTEKKKN